MVRRPATLLSFVAFATLFPPPVFSLETEKSSRMLERAVDHFVKSSEKLSHVVPTATPNDIDLLRKPWISKARLARIAGRYNQSLGKLTSQQLGEVSFRLSRHAFLLHQDNILETWIAKIPQESVEWQAKGMYLKGLLSLRKGDRAFAREWFTKAVQTAGTEYIDVASSAKMALARLAFDAGQYEQAKQLYTSIPKDSGPNYEDSLDESSWTLLKLGKNDLAAVHIDLLFDLFPQSPRLPNAGYLLGRLIEDQKNLQEGLKTLEQLVIRFSFEKEGVEKALFAFDKNEEKILFELDPSAGESDIRVILPPIGRHLLESQPLIREFLAELSELQDQSDDMEYGASILEASKLALDGTGGTTIESVVLLEWANDIERQILGANKGSSPRLNETESIHTTLKDVEGEIKKLEGTLVEIDRHIWINWKTLGGEREKQALDIKHNARRTLHELRLKKDRLQKLELQQEAMRLRLRNDLAQSEASSFRALRPQDKKDDPILRKLDQLRTTIRTRETQRIQAIRNRLPEISAAIREQQKPILFAKKSLLARARGELKDVLKTNRQELAGTLDRYRWSIAEARYRHFRAMDREIAKAKAENDQALADQEVRYQKFGSIQPQNIELDKQTAGEEAQRFAKAAKDYVNELNGRIQKKVETDRKRYKDYSLWREDQLIDDGEKRREEATLAYEQFVRSSTNTDRTPYALYRLAQLHYERAKSIARAYERSDKTKGKFAPDYRLTIGPLVRIKNEFKKFPHRDSVLYFLAYALLDANDTQNSVHTFEQFIGEYPSSRLATEVHLRIGEHYFSQRQFTKAMSHYQAVLSAGFNYFYDKALYKLAWANYLMGRYDSAIAHFLILLDYREALPDEQKKQFIEFADEAIEYVAFSLYRSGGTEGAKGIFDKTGWKPYSEKIIAKMAHIFVDRGNLRSSLDAFDLAISKFPLSTELPGLLESRIRVFEQLNDVTRGMAEKERALHLVGKARVWRKTNENYPEAIQEANRLTERVTLSLAAQYDDLAIRLHEKGKLSKAEALYKDVVSQFPGSISAYNAQFRIGELAFQKGDYTGAVLNYDTTVRNERFSHHFNSALYGIVVCREKELESRGGLSNKSPEVGNLIYAIENFVQRSPKNPKTPDALMRLGIVYSAIGEHAKARTAYLRLVQSYPKSRWLEEALIAITDTQFAEEKWGDGADFAAQTLKNHSTLSTQTRSKLVSMEEGGRFKAAGQSEEAFFLFQENYPESKLASKALFNAFAISKREGNVLGADKALDLLLTKYEKSPEAAGARYERAILADSIFDVDSAIANFELAIKSDLSADKLSESIERLAHLYVLSSKKTDKIDSILRLASPLKEPLRSRLELFAADEADREDAALSINLWQAVLKRPGSPSAYRVTAAANLARRLWPSDQYKDAATYEQTASKLLASVPSKERPETTLSLAYAKSEHISYDLRRLNQTKLNPKSPEALAASLKKKAQLLAEFEKSVLRILEFRAMRVNAKALFELGMAYQTFAIELRDLQVPESEKAEYRKNVVAIAAPLESKAKEALTKSYELLVNARLPDSYFNALADGLALSGVKIPKAPEQDLEWVEVILPDPPDFLVPTISTPEKVSAKWGLLLLASAGQTDTAKATATDEVKKGIAALKSIWVPSQRSTAIEAFGHALFLRPNFSEALFNLSVVQLYDGKLNAVAQLGPAVAKIDPLAPLRLKTVQAILTGKHKEAIDQAVEILSKSSNDETGRWLYCLALLQGSNGGDALRAAKIFIKLHPRSLFAHRALAAAYRKSGNMAMAEFILRRAHSIDSTHSAIANELALSLAQNDDMILRSTLLKDAAQNGHPEAVANWARLAFGVRRFRDTFDELSVASKASSKYHPTIEINKTTAEKTLRENP